MFLTPILALAVVFGLFEAGLRIAGYNPLKTHFETNGKSFYLRESASPKYRYEPNPGFIGKAGDLEIRINAAGFRGPEVSPEGSGRRRIALIGDSIVFSKEFREGEIFSGVLSEILNKIDPRYEVLNMGVEGFDTLETMEFFRDHGLKLKPEKVLYLYSLNDIGATAMDMGAANIFLRPRVPLRYKSRLWLWLEMKIRRLSLEKALSRKLESGRTYLDAYAGLIRPVEKDAFLEARFKDIDASQAAFDRTSDNKRKAVAEQSGRLWLNEYKSLENIGKIRYGLEQFKAMADAGGFKAIVVIVPFFYKIDGVYLDAPAHAIIRREAERLGLEVVDTLENFLPYELELLSNDNVHLNEKGHAIMAGLLKNILVPEQAPAAGPGGR